MLDPNNPADGQGIVATYLKLVETHATADVYPGSLRDLPHPKETIRAAFKTSTIALVNTGHLTAELCEYLEIGYVSLADYVDEEGTTLLRWNQIGGRGRKDDHPRRNGMQTTLPLHRRTGAAHFAD